MAIPHSGWCLIGVVIATAVCFVWWRRQVRLIDGQFDFFLCIFQQTMRYAVVEVHYQTEYHPNGESHQCQYA